MGMRRFDNSRVRMYGGEQGFRTAWCGGWVYLEYLVGRLSKYHSHQDGKRLRQTVGNDDGVSAGSLPEQWENHGTRLRVKSRAGEES